MRITGTILSSASILALASVATAPYAFSQDGSEDANERRLDQVTVTAQKREQNVQDVPIAISVIGGDQLDNAFTVDVEDIGQLAPSVTFAQGANDRQNSLRIRGVGTQVFSASVEPSVATVVDGVVLTRPGAAFSDLVDIERVEILRGPQGTLFGKNASAGVLNIATKAPSDSLELFGEVLHAEGNETHVKGSISDTLEGGLGVRASLYYRDREGHIGNFENGLGGKINGDEAFGGRLKLAWDLSDTVNIVLNADYSESEGACCQWQIRSSNSQALLDELAPVVPSDTNDRVNVDAAVRNENEHWGGSADVNWDIGEFTLTSITAYREWDNMSNNDVDSVAFSNPELGRTRFNVNAGNTNSQTFTQELRLASPAGRDVEYVAGLFYYDAEVFRRLDREIGVCLAPGVGPDSCGFPFNLEGFFESTIDTTNLSAFGQLDWHVSDRLTLIGGFRAIDEELDFVLQRFGSISGGPVGPLTDSTSDNDLTVKLGAQYDVNENVNAYFTYAQGYKGQAFDAVVDLQEDELDQFPIDAETSDAFEAGLKTSFYDGRLIINAAAFLNQYENFQGQSFNEPAARFVLANVGEVETSGLEVDFQALIGDHFTLSGGAAFIDATIEDFPGAQCYSGQSEAEGCIAGVQDLSGADLPNAPDIKFNVAGRYEKPVLQTDWTGYVQGSYVWQDEVQFSLNQNPGTIQDAYGLADFSIGAISPDGTIEASFFVKNAFDEQYAAAIFQTPLDAGGISHFLPRNYSRYVGGVLRLRY